MTEAQGRGQAVATWWRVALADRNSGAARGLAARMRRAGGIAVLAEPAVQDLARRLGMGASAAVPLMRLVQLLAEVRNDDAATLARRLGGAEPVLSNLRFQRLLRASEDELADQLRRAVIMADRRCNVARLAGDVLAWGHAEAGDKIRAQWCFDYFGDFRDEAPSHEVPAHSEETGQ